MSDGICTEVTNRTGLIILYDNPMETTSRAYYPGRGDIGHTCLSPSTSQSFWLAGVTLPQVVALVSTLVVQLARQAGHRGSELHRLQDLPDGFIRVLMQHVEVHSQRAREQGGVLARRDSKSELGPVTPPTSAHPSRLCPHLLPLPTPPTSVHPSICAHSSHLCPPLPPLPTPPQASPGG